MGSRPVFMHNRYKNSYALNIYHIVENIGRK